MILPSVALSLPASQHLLFPQCELIREVYGVVHLSTGDMLREAAQDPESAIGKMAKNYMESGKLVAISLRGSSAPTIKLPSLTLSPGLVFQQAQPCDRTAKLDILHFFATVQQDNLSRTTSSLAWS